jgi:hypothetical protein
MLAGFRTLFLGAEPTWEAWLTALKNDWVMAARRDAVTGGQLRMHGANAAVKQRILAQAADWQWWQRPGHGGRPLVSVLVLRPTDMFEAGKPERGLAARVRTAWTNTTQGLPKQPIAELIRLQVDDGPAVVGEALERLTVRKRNGKRQLSDIYHLLPLTDLKPGPHRLTATVKTVASGLETTRTVDFSAGEA